MLEGFDLQAFVTLVLGAGLGVFLKDMLVLVLNKVSDYVLKTENKIDDEVLAIVKKAFADATKTVAKEAGK